MKKLLIICITCLSLCGCVNRYEKAIEASLNGWPFWKEEFYIQNIKTYEILSPYYIQGIPYVEGYVRIVSRYNPYKQKLFSFFVRKDYPDSATIPNNQEWRDWMKEVRIKLKETL